MPDVVIEDQPDASRYALLVDGELVSVLDYRILGESISFPRTYTQRRHRGHGWAEKLVAHAVDDVERNSARRIVPMCWYVGNWFDAHPERAALLTR